MNSRKVGIEEARKRLGDLVTAVHQGDDVIITRNGRPAARLTSYQEDAMNLTAAPYGILTDYDTGEELRAATADEHAQSLTAGETGAFELDGRVVFIAGGPEDAETTIVNLTPHPVTIAGCTIDPDGRIPRVAEEISRVGEIGGLPVVEIRLGQVHGLPEPTPGTVYIVSRMVAEAAPARDDLVIPGKQMRDEQGRVVGAETLARLPQPADYEITAWSYAGEAVVVTMRLTRSEAALLARLEVALAEAAPKGHGLPIHFQDADEADGDRLTSDVISRFSAR